MRRLPIVFVLAACARTASPASPANPTCSSADEGRQLAAAGRIERAVRVLGDPALCAQPPADVAALLTKLRAELARVEDPDALIERGLAARAADDEVAAQQALSRALVSAETAGGTAHPAPWLRTRLNARSEKELLWSPSGRHVLLPEWNEGTQGIPARQATLLDVDTLRSIRIDLHHDATFSPDGRFLVTQRVMSKSDGSPDSKISVLAIDGGRELYSVPRATLTDFHPDGRFVWAARAGRDLAVHFVALDGKRPIETLRAPAAPLSDQGNPPELVDVKFGTGEVVVGVSWTALHVWSKGRLVATTPAEYTSPQLADNRIVYVTPRKQDRARMEFLDLGAPARPPTAFPDAGGPCGAAAVNTDKQPLRCSADRYAIANYEHVCVWDLPRKRLLHSIANPANADVACANDHIEIGERQGGATIEVFSATTGQRERSYRRAADRHADAIDTAPSGARLVARSGLRVIERGGREIALADSPNTTDARLAPGGEFVVGAGVRTSLWNARDGKLLWRSPLAPEAAIVAFDRTSGELVVASDEGATWRLNLGTSQLRASPPIPRCTTGAMDVGGDGRWRIACEGKPATLYREGESRPRKLRDGAVFTGGSLAFDGGDDTTDRVTIVPESAAPWSIPVVGAWSEFAIGISATGEQAAVSDGELLALYDRNRMRWKLDTKEPELGRTLWIGRDTVASCDGSNLQVWGRRGRLALATEAECALAFDPQGERLAYGEGYRVKVFDVAKRVTSAFPTKIALGGELESVAWSPDGKWLAAVADRNVFLWDVAAKADPTVVYVAGTAAAAVKPDHTVQLFGDADEARGLVSCRIGGRLYPYALCRDRFEH